MALVLIAACGAFPESLGLTMGFRDFLMLPAVVAEIGVLALTYRFACASMEPWARGIQAEDLVGRVLCELESEGWRSLHGLDFAGGDIDHVAVGPGGVVTVETKSRNGAVTRKQVRRMIPQASAHRRLLSDVAPSLGKVEALLAVRAPSLEPDRALVRDVIVVSVDHLADELRGRPTVMTTDEIESAYDKIVRAFSRPASASPKA